MSDPLTSTIRLTEPTVGGDSGTWGTLLNSNMVYIDEAINQTTTVSIADTNISLIADGSSSDQARYARYDFTGALTATRTVTLPSNVKIGYATNDTTGGHPVTMSAGATTLNLTDTSWTFFAVDGSNNVIAPTVRLGALNVTGAINNGGSITSGGALTISGGITGATSITLNPSNYNSGSAPVVSETSSVSNIGAGVFSNTANVASANALTLRTERTDGRLANLLFGASSVGTIAQNGGTGVTYNTTSDERLKDHVGGILNSGAIIDKIIPRWFRWKACPDRDPEPGFFAQQVNRVFPWAVTKGQGRPGGKDFQPWVMDASRMMPIVIAELQSLRRRVAKLEK